MFNMVGEGHSAVLSNDIFDNDIGIIIYGYSDGVTPVSYATGILIQENNIHDNEWGIYSDYGSLANIFSNNTSVDNTVFNFQDNTSGLYSAFTANSYLCNTCSVDNPDNIGGLICSSTSPLAAIGIPPVRTSPAVTVSPD